MLADSSELCGLDAEMRSVGPREEGWAGHSRCWAYAWPCGKQMLNAICFLFFSLPFL